MNKKNPVLRTCALTREKLDKKDLFRIVRDTNGTVFIDDTLKANGRGCYLKKDKDVIIKAQKNKVLDRNLMVQVNSEIYDELLGKL